MNISKTIYIKKGDSPKPPITNYFYGDSNNSEVNKALSIDRNYIIILSFLFIFFVIIIIVTCLIFGIISNLSNKKKEKKNDNENKKRENDNNYDNFNNMIMQYDRGDIYNNNYENKNIFPCSHHHIQPNIYQDNFENMIGYRQLVSTTFGKCICENNCQDCTKKKKCLNIPIINLDEDNNNDCEKVLVIEKFKFGPCLTSHKGCFTTKK
ncbi:Hypothetical protein SRAE_2000123300 [Strongyloides ratti]|uniref:Uncharacterized protein n=1 Tax=Strongyloides ratti TaxID=34506 RepID=A0A090LGB6_STRRB|nr:Hypothetical protein SRAE_2000123300 [Strongyloides ratti]CEF66565.1 Hypothetical protein SRAE_2000123300 [Strongyloides ratti]